MKDASNRYLLQLSTAMFTAYVVVGMPLPVLPLYVHKGLGYSEVVAGVSVGIHFLAMIIFRNIAGRLADVYGGKNVCLVGMLLCSLAGIPYLIVGLVDMPAEAQLAIIFLGRVCLGIGQSTVGTGNLLWGFGLCGPSHVGRVIAWSGIAHFGAIAVGAPLGLYLWKTWGIEALGIVSCLLPLLAFALDSVTPSVPLVKGTRNSAASMLRLVLRPGTCLLLHGLGYASISAFISLYFEAQNWEYLGIAVTCFGGCFALMRMFFGELPDRMDGKKLAFFFLVTEGIGLTIVALSSSRAVGSLGFISPPIVALIGICITGASCSLIYPSLGVQVLRAAPAHMRGSAVGMFTLFQDIAFGVSGPLMGFLVPGYGYPAVYFTASACAFIAAVLVIGLPAAPPVEKTSTG